MPVDKKYLIEIPGQQGTAYWGEERYNANKDALMKDHPDAIVFEVGPYSAEDALESDMFSISVPNEEGSVLWDSKKFNANSAALLKDHPNAQIERVRPVDYWEEQRGDLKRQLMEHEAQYGDFLDEYEAKRDVQKSRDLMSETSRYSPEYDYILENAHEYGVRNKEREALRKAIHDNPREKAERESLYNSIGELSAAIDKESNEAYAKAFSDYAAKGGKVSASSGDYEDRVRYEAGTDYYDSAQRMLKSAKETLEAPSKYDDSNGFVNFMKGAGNTLGSADFWTMGMSAIMDNLGARQAFEKIWDKFKTVDINELTPEQIDEKLTPGEKALVEAFTKKAQADAARAYDLSLGYQAGMSSAESLGFMAQFALTGGLTSAAAKGATKWAAKGLAKGFSNMAAKGVSKGMISALKAGGKFALGTTRSLIDAAVRTGVTTTAAKSISEQLLPNISEGTLPDANIAVLKGLGDAFIENWSEAYGSVLESVFNAPFKAMFPEWSKAIAKTPMMQFAERAGFNGYLTEIGEEWFGNAMRAVTKVDPEALKNFATVDNQIVTMTAFLPMTLIGGGVSMGQIWAAEKSLENKTADLRYTLEKAGLNMDEIDALVDYRQALSPQMLSDRFTPIITSIANNSGSPQLATDVFKSAGAFSQAVARYQAMNGGYQAEQQNANNALRDEMVEKMGGNKFWNTRQSDVKNENGEAYEFEEVQVVTGVDGSRFFIVGQVGDQLATIDEDGKTGVITQQELEAGKESGLFASQRTMMLDQFLSEDNIVRRRELEKQRMSEERAVQVHDLRAKYPAGSVINLGTRVNPINGVVSQHTANGVVVQTEDKANPFINVPYEQFAQAVNTPIRTLTDEQIAAEEAAIIEAKEAEKETELADTPEDMTAAEETTQTASEFEQEAAPSNIPINEDGTVNEQKFLEESPEEYVAWNDNNRQDGGADSREQLEMLIPVYQNMYNEAAKDWAANAANPVARRAAKESMAEWQDKISRINTLLLQYNAPAQAKQNLADRTVQAELEDLHDGTLNDAEIASNIDAHIAEAQSAYDEYAKTAPQMGTDRAAYKAAKAEYEAGLKELEQELNYWNEVKRANENYGKILSNEEIAQMEERRLQAIRDRAAELERTLGVGINVIERAEDVTNNDARAEIAAGRPPMGWFNVQSGKVDIFLPAVASAQLAEETIIHEVVGHKGLRGLLGEKQFNSLLDSVYKYMENNLSARELDGWLKYPGVKGDKRKAADEYLADLAERVDYNQDRTTWDKIVGFIKDILRKIGIGVNKDYLVDLVKRSYARLKENATNNLVENGYDVDEQNGDVRFSSRYITNDAQREDIISSIVEVTGRSAEDAERWLLSEESVASLVLADKEYLDYDPDEKYKAIKDNSDYPQGTVDFNNICRKRIPFTKMYTRLQRRYPNRIFTAEELADIRTIMSEDGLTVACGLCYVEDRRQQLGEVADGFIADLKDGFRTYAQANATKKGNAVKFLILVGSDSYVPTIYDLITLEGSDKLYREHRGIWDAFGAYNRARGQQTQNTFQGYAEYKREILGWSKAKVNKVNSLGGLRVFSYSDFEAHHLLDLVQIIIDCAAKGVMIQGYTKVPEFARAVANTNIKLNRSLIPLGDTGIVDGQLAFDPVEGIDINDPNFLESNDNVGNILIGINSEQIRLAMADPRIHYIIPYHARQARSIRNKLNVGAWSNYTDTQNERDAKTGKKVADNINIYTDILGPDVTNDREFVEKYLQKCAEMGRIPKFDEFLDKDAEGNYVYTPGYYKFLVDFKLFDESGNILPQKPVVAQFDDAFNMQILQDYAKGERETTGEQMNATYDKIVETLGLNEEEAEGEDIMFKTEYDRTPPPRDAVAKIIDYLFANKDKNKGIVERRVISAVTPRQIEEYRKKGIDNVTERFVHSIDNSSIRHKVKRHGGDNRTQEPLSKEEWHNILDVIENFDRVDKQKAKSGLDVIVYQKRYDDGTIYYVEEIRTGRESLALTTAYKKRGDSSGLMEHALPPTSETTLDNTSFESKDTNKSDTTNDSGENTFFKTSNHNQAIFVSNAAKAVEGIKMEKATPEQWLKMLEKNGGLKAGEDKWMGLSDWLKASDKKTLTKDEVLDFINEHMIIIEEQEYAFLDQEVVEQEAYKNLIEKYGEDFVKRFVGPAFIYEEGFRGPYIAINDPIEAKDLYYEETGKEIRLTENGDLTYPDQAALVKWAETVMREAEHIDGVRSTERRRRHYVTKNLDNYHEIALTVPAIHPWNTDDVTHFGDAGNGRAVVWIRFGETTTKNGEKVLVIDEVQSKRHDTGRKKGYADVRVEKQIDAAFKEYEQKNAELNEYYKFLDEKYGVPTTLKSPYATKEEIKKLKQLRKEAKEAHSRWIDARSQKGAYGIPDAPFEKNWHELAMKRMLRYAAENGFDYIAWTLGEQQRERYNLAKLITSVGVNVPTNSTGRAVSLHYKGEEGPDYFYMEIDEAGKVKGGHAKGRKLSEVVGKAIADQIMEVEDSAKIEAKDLRVGGEGLADLYDKMLPTIMTKYGKQWGVKVSDIELPNAGESGLTMHSIPVTEEMKESVMEGQTMFKTRMPNQSVADFLNEVVPEFESKYNVVVPASIMKLPTRAALAKAIKLDISEIDDEFYDEFMKKWQQSYAIYIPVTDENGKVEHNIIIFADSEYKTSYIVDTSLFHENIHGLVTENDELLKLGAWLYENDKQDAGISAVKPDVEQYDEDDRHEEMLTHYVSYVMALGFSQRALDIVPDELKPLLNYIYERFGYNPETEDGERRRRYVSERDEINGRTWTDRPSIKVTKGERKGGDGEALFKTAVTPEVRREMDVISAQAIVNGNYMKAPNGKDSKLTPEQWALVRTQNFKQWFGDWEDDPANASKVIDENGEPKVVYHQTNAVVYIHRETGENWDELDWRARQEWDERDDWEDYWEEQDFNTFSRVNARTTNEFDGFFFAPEYDEYHEYGERTIPAFLNIKHPASNKDYDIDSSKNNAGREERLRLQNEGFDGVIRMEGEEVDEYIAFEPSQIKSATDNTGEFSEDADIRFKTDTQGRSLSREQQEFFANSKAVDKDGNLLVLYHGTPRAGFTEFKSGWFTTSKEDAISYSGDRKGRLFDPNEKYEPETLTAGDFRLGYMTFDSEEDRAAFIAEHPTAESAMSESEFENARIQAEDEEYDTLTERKPELQKIWDAYREYERDHFVDTTIGEILNNPDAYTEDDLRRAVLAYDSNAVFDSIDELETTEERKSALVESLNYMNENAKENGAEGILDMVVATRVPRNGEGIKHNDLGNRTYEVYARIERPYEIDANGRGSEFESGDIYQSVKDALADEQYDGVIIHNWRVGRHQQLGDVVVPKNGKQIKLTTFEKKNSVPDNTMDTGQFSESEDIRFKTVFGGNSGYVNYSMSKRAAAARSEGRYPKSDFRKAYNVTANALDLLIDSNIIDANEWHHTSIYGNKTTFYGWYEDSYADRYAENKKEVDALAKEFVNARKGHAEREQQIRQRLFANEIDPEQSFQEEKENDRVYNEKMDEVRAKVEAIFNPVEPDGSGDETTRFKTRRPASEVVAEGLVLPVEGFTNLAADIFKGLPEDMRRQIVDAASSKDWDLKNAIFQMIASLAKKSNLTDEAIEVAKMIADNVEKAAGENLTRPLTVNEALWILYRATVNADERDSIAMAERAVVADNLGFSPKAREEESKDESEVRFKKYIVDQTVSAADAYTQAISYWGNRMNEAFVDQYDAVDHMIKAIEDATGKKAESWEDIRLILTQSASKGLAKLQEVERELIQKMWDAVNEFAKIGVDKERLARYVILKHGLERNEAFAKRDARRSYEEEYNDEVKRIKKDSSLTDDEKQQKMDEAKDILDNHLLDIDAQTDERYLENRKRDYSGILAMFADYPGLMSADNYSSEEEYRTARRKTRVLKFRSLAKAEKEAQREIDAFEDSRDALVKNLWDSINKLTKGTLKMQHDYGMLSNDSYITLSGMFDYYVPLRGFSDNTGEDLYDYYSHNVSDGYAPPVMGAKGRKSEAESPFGWMAAMAATAVVSGEKNLAKQALYYFAMNRKSNDLLKISDVWYIQDASDPDKYYPAYPPQAEPNNMPAENAQQYADWESQMEKLAKQGLAVKKTNKLNVAEVVNFGKKDAPEHVIKVNINGEEKQLIVNANPRAAQAINGLLNIEANPDYQKVLGKVLRWMSQTSTGWNPEFWMTNIARDTITAFSAIHIKEDKAYNEAFRKNWAEAWKLVKLLPKLKDGTLGTGRLEDLLREAVENGVQTGYSHIKSMEEWDKDMKKYLKELNKDEKKVVTAAKNFIDGVQTFSEAMELVSRFATYITSRQLGRDVTRSVADAKEVTVNFNRKGSGMRITFDEAKKLKWANGKPIFSEKWTGWKRRMGLVSVAYVSGMSALAPFGRKYMMFFNAGVQGLNMWLQMYRNGFGRSVNLLAGTAFALGILNSVLQGILDGDDDDYQQSISDYERRSNLMLGANGYYLKIALPQEIKAFYGLGDILYNYASGNYHHKDTPTEIFRTISSQLVDILPINPMGGWQEFIPSMGRAVVEAGVAVPFLGEVIKGTNKNFAGSPLREEKKWLSDAERESLPKYTFATDNTWSWLVGLAELANRATGGSEYDAGWLQLDPARMQHYIEQATGGLGGFVGKIMSTVNAVADPEVETTVTNIPFINKVFTVADERGKNKLTNEQFYYYKGVADAAEMRYDKYQKSGDREKSREERRSDEYKIMRVFFKYEGRDEAYKERLKRAKNKEEEKELKEKRDANRKRFLDELAEKGLL